MSDYYEDEWYEEDYDSLWAELASNDDGSTDDDVMEFCFCCGYPLEQGECVNPYCTENPSYSGEDGDGPA
jgi:hypothetical protein